MKKVGIEAKNMGGESNFNIIWECLQLYYI